MCIRDSFIGVLVKRIPAFDKALHMVHVFILAHGQRRHGTGGIYFSLPVNDQCLGLCLFDLHRQIDETAHKGKGQQYAIAEDVYKRQLS